MTVDDLKKRITELRQQQARLFSELHQTVGAIQALEYVVAQMQEAPDSGEPDTAVKE